MRGHRCRELGAGAPESASIVTEKRSPAAGNRLDSALQHCRIHGRGGSFIAVDVAYLGSADDVAPLLALFREIPAIVLDTLGTMPISLLGTIAAEPVDPPRRLRSPG